MSTLVISTNGTSLPFCVYFTQDSLASLILIPATICDEKPRVQLTLPQKNRGKVLQMYLSQ